MDKKYRAAIAEEFISCIVRTMQRIKSRQGAAEANYNPFQEHLLPKEAIFWARFERSFSTSFGQRVIETVSKHVALAFGAEDARTQHLVNFKLAKEELDNISKHLQALRQNNLGRKPNWDLDLASIRTPAINRDMDVTVTFDLWFKKNNTETFVSIKTVKPNIDQTEIAKSAMLKAKLAFPDANVFYGLYYNPYGDNKDNYKHNPPFKIFDMINDSVVLIGKDYWDTIGKEGAYEEVLSVAAEVQDRAQEIMKSHQFQS